jgi:hypothetical protein
MRRLWRDVHNLNPAHNLLIAPAAEYVLSQGVCHVAVHSLIKEEQP